MFGRSIIYNAIPIIEGGFIGNKFFYGLDEVRVGVTSLRELFYELPPERADEFIGKIDNTDRRIPITMLRDAVRGGRDIVDPILSRLRDIIPRNNPYRDAIMLNAARILSEMSNN